MPVVPASSPSGRFPRFAVVVMTMLVFGGAVALVTLQSQAGLRQQILQREAEILTAIASMQLDEAAAAAEAANLPLDEVPGSLLVAVLKTQRLADVSGVRIYDAEQRVRNTYMLAQANDAPAASTWSRVTQGEPVGRLHRKLDNERATELLLPANSNTAFEAWVPLRRGESGPLIGAAEFWMNGAKLTAQLAAHDGRLWTQATIAWLVGSAVILAAFGWAFRRLDATNRELRARSEDLQRANRELVLAAKTSALGAVTAHLMHEIKNPLAGLEVIVAGQNDGGSRPESGGGELIAASELTRRLRTMVNDVAGVLRDEQTGAEFELTTADVAELVQTKVQSEVDQRGVQLEVMVKTGVTLSGRRANLATLVLRNLLQNAIEATPRGGRVTLIARATAEGATEFLVEDGAGGLPAPVRARLFQPCTSTKVGGSGLGLALSHQLAQHAGGRLELVRSDERGTCFRLVLQPEA
jgi:signal transduction histidine kinase